jgi:VanZ family protein
MQGISKTIYSHRRWILLAGLALFAAALVATHLPPEDVPNLRVRDKILHLIGYFVLAGFSWAVLWVYGAPTFRRLLALAVFLPIWAAVDELTQPFFRRTADLDDWAADMIGCAAAIVLAQLVAAAMRRLLQGKETSRKKG